VVSSLSLSLEGDPSVETESQLTVRSFSRRQCFHSVRLNETTELLHVSAVNCMVKPDDSLLVSVTCDAFEVKGLRKILRVSRTAQKTNERVLNKAGSKEGTVRHRRSKEASIQWSHREETRKLPGERDNARNNARCTQARKTTHGLDRQHQTRRGQDSPWKSHSE